MTFENFNFTVFLASLINDLSIKKVHVDAPWRYFIGHFDGLGNLGIEFGKNHPVPNQLVVCKASVSCTNFSDCFRRSRASF